MNLARMRVFLFCVALAGFPLAAQAMQASRASPRTQLDIWRQPRPEDEAGAGAYVWESARIRLTVSAQGRVEGCEADGPGAAWIVQRTCPRVQEARFHPATDDSGAPIRGDYSFGVRAWRFLTPAERAAAGNR